MAFTIDQVKVDVRYYLGGIPETTLSDTLLEDIINRTMTRYGLDFNVDDDYCKTVYYSILETLKYLIRENISSSASTGGGEIKSRSEKVGDISVKTEYTDGTDASESRWDTLYDYYLANPTDVCEDLADLAKSSFATVYFGDVSNKEVIELILIRTAEMGGMLKLLTENPYIAVSVENVTYVVNYNNKEV